MINYDLQIAEKQNKTLIKQKVTNIKIIMIVDNHRYF